MDGLPGNIEDYLMEDFSEIYEETIAMWNDYEDTDDRLNSLIDENEDYWEGKEDVEDFKC